jgi:beta-galactosidase
MIGVYYYPEQWSKEQWERDIKNIKVMGMKHIHLAEFSWIHLEPEENKYDFSWLDRVIDLASKQNLEVILGTPTATPPVWMSHNYPDILMVRQNGRRVTHGSRAHRCVNSKIFNKFADRITSKMAKRYGQLKPVVGWQIDNEVGHYANAPCYCDECLLEFRQYLQDRYETIELLNNAWAGDFWSQNLQSFDQVQFPNPDALAYIPNEHALLDFKRFFSISLSEFLSRQSKVLRPLLHEKAWVTHNFMKDDRNHYPAHVNEGLDLHTLTIYPVAGLFKGYQTGREHFRMGDSASIAFNHDLMRSYRGRWGIMEQQPGQVNWGPCNSRPYPGTTRLWLWTAIAHGATFLDTYRYRQPLSGAEQYHKGLVDLDGISLTRGGIDFSTVAKELEQYHTLLQSPGKVKLKKAALLYDWDSLTMLSIHPQNDAFDPYSCLLRFYAAIKQLGFDVDVIHSHRTSDLSQYEMVCTGLYDLIDDDEIKIWQSYVENGGHLIITPRTATRNKDGHFPQIQYGQRITELTGAKIAGYDCLPHPHTGTISLLHSSKSILWHRWSEQYAIDDQTESLAYFSDQFYKGSCAAFKKQIGKGTITCIGVDSGAGIGDLIKKSMEEEFDDLIELPDHTLFRIQGSLGIFLNYDDKAVYLPESLKDQLKVAPEIGAVEPCDILFLAL